MDPRKINRAIEGQVGFSRPPQDQVRDKTLNVVRSQVGLVDLHAGFPRPPQDPFDLGSRKIVTDPIRFRETRIRELVKEREYLQELLKLIDTIQALRRKYSVQVVVVGAMPHGIDVLTGSEVERRDIQGEIQAVSKTIREINLELQEIRKSASG